MAYSPPPKMDPAAHGPPSVINAGLMRTGSLSMARAYAILGLRAHHGLDMPLEPDRGIAQWAVIEAAADATWPHVPGTPAVARARLTRAEWDEVFGTFDCITDIGAIFADQLVAAYPEAKVVVVQRDFDRWWESFQPEVSDGLFSPLGFVVLPVIAFFTGNAAGRAMVKTLKGAFDARNLPELKANARKTYFDYYDRIREVVPAERRLEYKLGDGWEPLCEFLGKEVPDVPFPRLNDRKNHKEWQMGQLRDEMVLIWKIIRGYVWGGLLAVLVAVWMIRRRG